MTSRKRQDQRGEAERRYALGMEIQFRRAAARMTQTQLADAMGRSQEWVSRVETGDVTLSAFEYERLAHILRISPHVLTEIAWRGLDKWVHSRD